MSTDAVNAGAVKTSRVEALSDGVFAIVMTLLIIEMFVPELEHVETPDQLVPALQGLGPVIFSYVLSFIALGIFWISHHFQFHYIHRTDRVLLWLNLLLLMSVSTVPFSAALLGRHMMAQPAIILYGCNLIAAGLMLFLHWWYATGDRHLLRPGTPPELIFLAKRRILLPSALYLVTIGVSFASTTAALVMFAAIPIVHILPSRIDTHWAHRLTPPPQ
jgi:uncharacterized membrane protein